MKRKPFFQKILFWAVLVFFYLPIAFMIVFSFNASKSLTNFTGFSLRWYQAMIQSHDMMDSLYVTLAVALLATVVSTIVGTISAIGLVYSRKWIRKYVSRVNDLPMMNPEIVTAIGLMLLFLTFRIERGFFTLLLAHIAFCIPYVMLSVMPKLRQLDPNLADAAMDLGASPLRTLWQVIVPEIMPGIVSGALIAFTMSFDDFIISYFATGQGVKNLSIMVYTMSKRVNPSINAISTLIVLLITVAVLAINFFPMLAKKFGWDKNHYRSVKRVGVVLAAILVVVGFFFTGKSEGTQMYAGQSLHIYLPGEYISDEMLAGFEEETGATVIVDNFESNEQMYIKVANGESFDILIPSDYMIQRLIEEDLLMELDALKIEEALLQLDEETLGMAFDPENAYSVPYFFGDVGIVYDTTVVDIEDLENDGWNIFLNEKYKGDIYLYDSERDQFMAALKALGYSMNTENEQELEEAFEWLSEVVTTMEPEIVTDEIIDNMVNQRKALGLIYSGDATYVLSENEDLAYFRPEEGTNIWLDAMCIPKTAQNVDLAYAFINYVIRYESQILNSSYVGYTSVNQDAKNELANGEFEGIDSYIPRSGNPNDETFQYNAKTRQLIADYWSRVKVIASNAN